MRRMDRARLHRVSVVALHLLSFTALLPLLIAVGGGLVRGHLAAPAPDEGTGAHVFQLSIAALLPSGVLCLATAPWDRPARVAAGLAAPAAFVALAFGLLYYYEHLAVY